jgi:hypothetical protein
MKATRNPRKRPDSSGRLRSDAAIRREKLQEIATTGSTEGINPRSLKRFWEKGYLQSTTTGTELTKKGKAVAAGTIGKAGRGAVDFDTANRAGKSSRDHAARAQAMTREGGTRAAEKAELEHFAELEQEHQDERKAEAPALSKIVGFYAVTVAPSDGSTLNADNIKDLEDAGWTVAPAPSAPARLGSRLPGAKRERYESEEPFYNPGDPLGPLGEARAVVLRSEIEIDLDTLSTIRQAGFDASPAPMKLRKAPPAPKITRNPSPGEMINGEHASAAERMALAKALAWYGKESLVTEPQLLKAWKAPNCAVEVGLITAIEYDSNKFDGKWRIYRHDATAKRRLFISPDGSTLIVWPPFRITKRGIEG